MEQPLRYAFRNLMTPGLVSDALSGDSVEWATGDWRTVLHVLLWDAKHLTACFLIDGTGGLGHYITSEVLRRRSLAKAQAIGSECFCVFHDCDSKDCPEGFHDD